MDLPAGFPPPLNDSLRWFVFKKEGRVFPPPRKRRHLPPFPAFPVERPSATGRPGPMSTPPRLDRQAFLDLLRKSALLSDERLAEVARQFPAGSRPRSMARALVRQGELTRFQAERL